MDSCFAWNFNSKNSLLSFFGFRDKFKRVLQNQNGSIRREGWRPNRSWSVLLKVPPVCLWCGQSHYHWVNNATLGVACCFPFHTSVYNPFSSQSLHFFSSNQFLFIFFLPHSVNCLLNNGCHPWFIMCDRCVWRVFSVAYGCPGQLVLVNRCLVCSTFRRGKFISTHL